jgi:hypothetical protein
MCPSSLHCTEGPLLQRTLLSPREAARHARTQGITVELVAALDRPDAPTCEALRGFGSDGFDGWTVVEVDHGALGPSRYSGIEVARGACIYIMDGDDLISFNSFALRAKLVAGALCRLADRHNPSAFANAVHTLFA